VAGTVTLKNAAMLCQLWNVRHLIIKGGIAKITDVNGRIKKEMQGKVGLKLLKSFTDRLILCRFQIYIINNYIESLTVPFANP